MLEKIRFQNSVADDLVALLDFYETYSLETANRVRESLVRTFQLIEANPEMYAVVYDDIRLVKTHRYPILVKYKIVSEVPLVLAVFHSKSKPNT